MFRNKSSKTTYGIVGLGRFGQALAQELAESGAELIVLDRDEEKVSEIRELTENATGSPRGKEILDNFSAFLPKFKKVLPYDYDRMLRVIASVEARGLDGEQAQIEAFYAVQKHK